MLLAADIGNTQIKLGVFQGEHLVATWHIATDSERLADEYAVLVTNLLQMDGIDKTAIHGAVYASVVPVAGWASSARCSSVTSTSPALRVGVGVKTGIRIQYEPRELGPDRIAVALGALRLHAPPVIVVSLGTATVFEAVSRDGVYLGGAIAPGIGVAADALSESRGHAQQRRAARRRRRPSAATAWRRCSPASSSATPS